MEEWKCVPNLFQLRVTQWFLLLRTLRLAPRLAEWVLYDGSIRQL